MKFDVVFSFITPAGHRASGFLTAEPMEGSLEQAIALRDKMQSNINDLTNLTIFTRDSSPILAGRNPTPQELTLPQDLIRQSIMVSQIIEQD